MNSLDMGPLLRRHDSIKRLLFFTIGGLLFSVVIFYGYSKINPEYYSFRDDGIITLSHAKNLVDYGFIGVNPSGERVEGFSAPMQFFVYALAYKLAGVTFSTYALAQTIICTFFIGGLFFLFFEDKPCFAACAVGVSSIILTTLTPFMEWHGSGMENAITHLLLISTVYLLFRFSTTRKIHLSAALIPFFASISRIDGIYHVFPVLLIFSIYWLYIEKNKKGFLFTATALSLWVAFNAVRYAYFGDAVPNTGYAQGISIGNRVMNLIRLDGESITSALAISQVLFSAHGGYYLMAALPVAPLCNWQRNVSLLLCMSTSLVFTSWFNPFLFGPTRLDITRTTTQMALFVVIAIVAIASLLSRRRMLFSGLFLAPVGLFVHGLTYIPAYNACCTISGFDKLRERFLGIAKSENLPRPTVANPDLGIMSWHKQFNIVDLGKLASRILATETSNTVVADYFFDYAAPDIIESHEYWSCRNFDAIFSDSRLQKLYTAVEQDVVRSAYCPDKQVPVGIWIRKDILESSPSAERRFIDHLARDLDTSLIRKELSECQSHDNGLRACTYISRTAFRFLPEFRDAGLADRLAEIFAESRTRDVDLFFITGYKNPMTYRNALSFIRNHSSGESH